MRMIFMGTPEFSVPGLQKLIDSGHEITAVATQPDRLRGRSGKPAPSAVKECAIRNGIDLILQPEKIRNTEFTQQISDLKPELIVVIAYGKILPPDLLHIPKYGCVNVHASLLPKYRGAWPIAAAIMNGDYKTGVTTMLMDEGMDTGNILLRKEISIDDNMTFGQLYNELSRLSADVLIETVEGLEDGSLKPTAQESGEFKSAGKISHGDEHIDWMMNAAEVHNHIRAMDPEPGAYTIYEKTAVKLFGSDEVKYSGSEKDARPGEIIYIGPDGVTVACGEGTIRIRELTFAGAKRLTAEQYFRGRKIRVGGKFE